MPTLQEESGDELMEQMKPHAEYRLRWKRSLDLSCIVIALPVWLPVMLLISAWIKAVSRGPVFFR